MKLDKKASMYLSLGLFVCGIAGVNEAFNAVDKRVGDYEVVGGLPKASKKAALRGNGRNHGASDISYLKISAEGKTAFNNDTGEAREVDLEPLFWGADPSDKAKVDMNAARLRALMLIKGPAGGPGKAADGATGNGHAKEDVPETTAEDLALRSVTVSSLTDDGAFIDGRFFTVGDDFQLRAGGGIKLTLVSVGDQGAEIAVAGHRRFVKPLKAQTT